MNKKIAVTGEGPTDYGRYIYNQKDGKNEWEWGPVSVVLNRCIEDYGYENIPAIEFIPVQKEQIKSLKLLRTDKDLDGLAIPARKFKHYCRQNTWKYGVFYADADKRESSAKVLREARHHFEEVYKEAAVGLEMDGNYEFIPMIPLKMIECWLLADEESFQMVYGTLPTLPKNPELIWGDKRDPKSDYPKHYLSRVLSQLSGREETGNQNVYCRLAEHIAPGTLREKCSVSFRRFYSDFKRLLEC